MPHAVNSRLGFDMNVGAERKSVLPGVFRAMTGFYLGVLIFRFKDEAAWSDRAPFNWTIGIYWLFGLLTLCLISPFQFRGILPVLFVFVAAPLLVIWGARIQTMAPRTESVAKWLGHMSFPLYCVHFPIGQIVYLAGERSGFSLWTDVFVAAILSMVTALLTCAYIEEPLRAFLTNAAFFRSAQRPGVAQAGNQTGATMKIRRVARGRVGKSDC